MKLEHYPLAKLEAEIIGIVGRHLNLADYQLFFFGSRVKGDGTDRSDIDIGIKGSQSIPRRALALIRNELDDLPILYKIDVVDFSTTSEVFQKNVGSKIESIKV
ncbi:MAG: nucleotidyltransferase domain-containing protein [Patescibacteria group bacterium]